MPSSRNRRRRIFPLLVGVDDLPLSVQVIKNPQNHFASTRQNRRLLLDEIHSWYDIGVKKIEKVFDRLKYRARVSTLKKKLSQECDSMRGSHQMPLMPVPLNSAISCFDGPPIVSCAAFAMHKGKMTEPVDAFAHPFWDTVRDSVSRKAIDMRAKVSLARLCYR
jgi:hypothetical protein